MIAIKNLFYLLLYAWDAFDEGQITAVDAEPETDLLNLLAGVLCRGVDHLARRGIDRGYLSPVLSVTS
jgi:5-methylcytosine-specific restriction enzyme subunit McrC